MCAEEWKSCSIGEIAAPQRNALVGGPFGSNLVSADYVPDGVPVIRGQNLGLGRWVEGDFVFVTAQKAASLAPNLARPGDLVFTQRGTLGQVAVVPGVPFGQYLVSQSQMKLTVDPAKADTLFIYYVFQSREQQDYIRRHAIQTGVPHTNLSILRDTPLRLPDLSEQQAISAVLGGLDSKIELNRRMNKTLEAMARAIFKSWFVDFDPVYAKAGGHRPIGIDANTAAIFPDSLHQSLLGEIPDGWTVQRIHDVAAVNPRSIQRSFPHDTIQYVDISSVNAGKLEKTADYPLRDAPSRAQRLVRHGDTIWSCVRPNRRSYLFVHQPPENLVVSTGFAVLAPQEVSPSYLYAWVTTDQFIDYLTYNADGSAYPAVRPDRFSDAEILAPPVPVLARFEELVGPMRDAIAHHERESRTLAAVRDALLPKLLSGEVRVKDAERLVEASYP